MSVVKIPHFHHRGHEFSPWLGNYDPACCRAWLNEKEKKKFLGIKLNDIKYIHIVIQQSAPLHFVWLKKIKRRLLSLFW